jgi:tetratricopeptide (TPR) repeat protein
VRRFIGDGRNVLLAGGKRYDVLVSEPSNPWIAGVASLFSRDFYELAKAHLAPGGVYCQWAQMYELGARNVKMIYRTFYESFPYVYAISPSDRSTDTILIGSLSPIELDVGRLEQRMKASAVLRAELERGDTTYVGQIIGGVFMVPGDMASFTAGAPVNTDDMPRLEYFAPRDLLASSRGNRFAQLVRGEHWPYGRLVGVVTGLGEGDDRIRRELEIARGMLEFGRLEGARRWLDAAVETAETGPLDVAGLLDAEQRYALCEPRDYLDPELPVTEGGAPLAKPTAAAFVADTDAERDAALESYGEALGLLAEGRFPPAYDILAELPERADSDAGRDISYMIAYAAYKSVDLDKARDLLDDLIEADDTFLTRRPAARYYLGRSLYGMGSFREGLEHLDRFRRDHPSLAREAVDKRLGSR